MEEIKNYAEASMNLFSAENDLKKFLFDKLGLNGNHIKSIRMTTIALDTKVKQVIIVELRGINRFTSDDMVGLKGISIITPNKLHIEVGDFDL